MGRRGQDKVKLPGEAKESTVAKPGELYRAGTPAHTAIEIGLEELQLRSKRPGRGPRLWLSR